MPSAGSEASALFVTLTPGLTIDARRHRDAGADVGQRPDDRAGHDRGLDRAPSITAFGPICVAADSCRSRRSCSGPARWRRSRSHVVADDDARRRVLDPDAGCSGSTALSRMLEPLPILMNPLVASSVTTGRRSPVLPMTVAAIEDMHGRVDEARIPIAGRCRTASTGVLGRTSGTPRGWRYGWLGFTGGRDRAQQETSLPSARPRAEVPARADVLFGSYESPDVKGHPSEAEGRSVAIRRSRKANGPVGRGRSKGSRSFAGRGHRRFRHSLEDRTLGPIPLTRLGSFKRAAFHLGLACGQ